MGEYQVADATKADLVNTVRVAWTAGDKVFAYSADGYLGELTASLDESGDDRYAKLSGTITDPGKTITLVYSPLLTSSNKTSLFSDGKLSLNFATQDGAKVPFVVYGTLDVTGSISGKIVPFKFATSVMKVNCTGLSEEEDITKAEVSNVNTVCEITFKDDAAPEVAGKTLGTITRKGTGAFCSADSRAIFQLAIVATEAAQPSERVLTISQDKDHVADFSACALASGKSYNSVYAMAPAPTFKAVYNTTGDANTLTFYYDAKDHSSEGTVYEGSTGDYYLCHDNMFSSSSRWGYNGIRGSIKGVVIDESVAGYHGLTSTGFMFSDFTNTASISGEELLDVSNVTDMRFMFGSVGLSVNPFNEVLNISGWNTSKVQNLDNMFLNYGRNLTNFTLDLSGWDVTNVTTATDMFKHSGYSSTSWSVTIPAKTTLKAGGEKANTASEWYMGDGTTTVAPYGTGTFIILPEGAEGFVDLGVKDADGKPLFWAECNLGASNPQDYGDYFAWGETAPYYTTTGGWPATPTWKSGKDSGYAWQSYCGQSSFDEWSTPPYDATSKILLPAYDAATKTNSSWRTPTSDEFKALAAGCVWIWTTDYNSTGKAGYIVYKAKNNADKGKANMDGTWKKWDVSQSKYVTDGASEATGYTTSDTHIFFPAAGYGNGTSLSDAGSSGGYWSSSLYTDNTGYAYGLYFLSSFVNPQNFSIRYLGFSVRPVTSGAAPAPAPLPAGALAGEFSVSADKKVHFSQGNLYYDGSAFKFEANQYSGTSYAENHVSHFYWSKDASVAYAVNYSDSGDASDVFFTNKEGFKVNVDGIDKTGWRTLSTAEWQYLFNNHVKVWGQCNSVYGYFIAPDGFVGDASTLSSLVSDWTSAEAAGIVFLPAAGDRDGSDVYSVGNVGYYWSSTALDGTNAYCVTFGSYGVLPDDYNNRNLCSSVRLVTDVPAAGSTIEDFNKKNDDPGNWN